VLAVLATLAAACTSGSGTASGTDRTTTTPTTAGGDAIESSTTTTTPPIIIAVSPDLALATGQCYAALPPPTTTPSDSTTTTADAGAEVPPTLPATTTTLARAATVAVVDCNGTNDGEVYFNFCLGPNPDFANDLTAEACPGTRELEYPGDRTIRRAASRICLERFEEIFAEPYATSSRIAEEFVPTKGLWENGDRRVICLATAPVPTTDTTSAAEPADTGSAN
jgi:hypothetical protein